MNRPDDPAVPDNSAPNEATTFDDDLDTRPVWNESTSLAALEKAMHIIVQGVTPDGTGLADQREPLMWEFVNMLHDQVQRLNQALDEIIPELQSLQDAQQGSQEKANELQRLTNRSTNLSHRRDAFAKMHQTAAETYHTQTGNIWQPRGAA